MQLGHLADGFARGPDPVYLGPPLDYAPVWSADGHQVFFQSTRNGSPDLYVRSAVAGTPEEVLLKGPGPKAPTDVTADGRILLYNQGTATTWQIWYLPLAGDPTPRPFVQTTFEAREGSSRRTANGSPISRGSPAISRFICSRFPDRVSGSRCQPASASRCDGDGEGRSSSMSQGISD